MNEEKYTANDGGSSSVNEKKSENSQGWGEFAIDLEHGKMIFSDRVSLKDHTQMRSQQLCALLRMTYGQHSESFEGLGLENRDTFHWHLHQMAVELDACILEVLTAGEGK